MARSRFATLLAVFVPVGAALAVACDSGGSGEPSTPVAGPGEEGAITLRLGYFANLTHAPAVMGVAELSLTPVSQ